MVIRNGKKATHETVSTHESRGHPRGLSDHERDEIAPVRERIVLLERTYTERIGRAGSQPRDCCRGANTAYRLRCPLSRSAARRNDGISKGVADCGSVPQERDDGRSTLRATFDAAEAIRYCRRG